MTYYEQVDETIVTDFTSSVPASVEPDVPVADGFDDALAELSPGALLAPADALAELAGAFMPVTRISCPTCLSRSELLPERCHIAPAECPDSTDADADALGAAAPGAVADAPGEVADVLPLVPVLAVADAAVILALFSM